MKLSSKIISVLLSVCLLFSSFSFAISGEDLTSGNPDEIVSSLPFAAISDVHYYPQSYTGNNCTAWQEYCTMESKEYQESDALTKAALDSIALKAGETGTKYVLIPGDLTKDSEYEAHVELAALLEQFENDTGIQVIVTNGNHDINNQKACTFENGKLESARCINQAEFREVYKNLGFDLAYDEYQPPEGSYQGGLSYAVNLDSNYKLIVIDSCKYDPINPAKDQTDGMIADDQMNWILEKAAEAEAEGMTPIAMMHHSVAPHMKLEPSVTFAFCVDNYQSVAEQFADAGIHYVFTGHLHTNDISSVTSDNGETIYDCEVGSITGFPNTIREMKIQTYGNGESNMDYSMLDVDYAHKISVDGITYEKPFSAASFAINYGGKFSDDGNADAVEFFMGIIKSYALPYLEDISAAGGIDPFLQSMGIDLKTTLSDFLSPYIGEGIKIGNIKVFTIDNIMWFINDLFQQVQELYIDNPDELLNVCRSLITKIADFEVSDIPCTKFAGELGFGDTGSKGTMGNFILSAMYYWYTGNEDISDDQFVKSVIANFKDGDLTEKFFNFLIDLISDDLVDGVILSKLDIRIGKLFNPNSIIGSSIGCTADYFVNHILKGNITYKNLVDTFFSFGILPYTSLYDILDKLLIKEYLTDSQMDAIGEEIAYAAGDFVTDTNPMQSGDNDVTYSTAAVTPEVTKENYRLPTMVSLTLGENSTSAYINWFSKNTVSGSDIEIIEADNFTAFSGIPTTSDSTDFTISTKSETVERTYPGIDFGVIGFFNYSFTMNRHTVSLSELKPDTKYFYRVGDAQKGWWSEKGVLETPDNSDNVTFFHMSDPQSQNLGQYTESWANVVHSAFNLYPDAKFIMCTGDLVDYGSNNDQWQWMFDTASANLMSTYLMPATGNHEEKADYSTVNNFTLPNMPEQDTANGVYYSFDYNNVHIAVLNTNDLDANDALSDTQIQWLKNDMSKSGAQWKIVALHKAIYSNGSHYDDDDVCAMRDQLSVLMPQLDIDMVLQGHDHVYLRTYSIDSNLVTDSQRVLLSHNGNQYIADVQPTGTTYVISGTSGVKTYIQKNASETDKYFPRAEITAVADQPMFSAIQIESGILYFDSYKVNGDTTSKVDSFAIQKDTTQGDVTGTAEDVSAKDKNSSSTSFCDFIKKLFKTFSKILTVISNLFNYFS